MNNGDIVRRYRTLSAADRGTFDRWLKANALVGSIFAAGLIAMALVGANSSEPRDATNNHNVADAVASNRDAKISWVRAGSTRVLRQTVSSPGDL